MTQMSSFSRGAVAIVTECSRGTWSVLWDMPFLSFYSVIHMVNQSQWTRGLHDVICQSIAATWCHWSVIAERKDLLLEGQMSEKASALECVIHQVMEYTDTVLPSLFVLQGAQL